LSKLFGREALDQSLNLIKGVTVVTPVSISLSQIKSEPFKSLDSFNAQVITVDTPKFSLPIKAENNSIPDNQNFKSTKIISKPVESTQIAQKPKSNNLVLGLSAIGLYLLTS